MKSIKVKSTTKIIGENNDGYYYNHHLFPIISPENSQAPISKHEANNIRYSFYDDIAKKYGVERKHLGFYLKQHSLEIIRSMAVFGDHMHIIDGIKINTQGSF